MTYDDLRESDPEFDRLCRCIDFLVDRGFDVSRLVREQRDWFADAVDCAQMNDDPYAYYGLNRSEFGP